MSRYTSASDPRYDGRLPHLRCLASEVAPIVLLPGDPARVGRIGEGLRDFRIVSDNREFLVGRGTFDEVPVTVCSTGIGAPSTEIAVVELIRSGARALIRVGGCGALRAGIECGDLILNSGMVRLGGASIHYARPEYPAVASFDVLECLRDACREHGARWHVGIGASVGSFYRGQGRAGPSARPDDDALYREMLGLGVLNMEMEAETVLTLGSLYGVHAGSIVAVHCNRVTNRWLVDDGESQGRLCRVALSGARRLYERLRLEEPEAMKMGKDVCGDD